MERPHIALLSLLVVTAGTAAAGEHAIVSTPGAHVFPKYRVTEIPPPPQAGVECAAGYQHSTYARRMNESAEAVGYYNCHSATGDPAAPYLARGDRAFRWSQSTGSVALDSVGSDSTSTLARDINESGTAVGWEYTSVGVVAPLWPAAGGVTYAFEPTQCPSGNATFAMADGINDFGSMAGRDRRVDETGTCAVRMLLKLASGEEFVGPVGASYHLNNHNIVAGWSSRGAVKWSPAMGEVVLSPRSASQTHAIAWNINDRNEAVGHGQLSDLANNNCLLGSSAKFWAADGTETTLPGVPGAINTLAYGINIHADAVGTSNFEAPCGPYDPALGHAVIWRKGTMRDLNTLVPQQFADDVQLTVASSINDRGQILARGIRRNEPKVPCPAIYYDEQTGEPYYNTSLMCQPEYAFLLTPRRQH